MSKVSYDYKYAGWVPTALGALSFRAVGQANHPTRTKPANVAVRTAAGEEMRLLVCYQRRDLWDGLFRKFRDWRRTKSFWFVAFASALRSNSASSNTLEGNIYIYISRESWERGAELGHAVKIKKLIPLLHEAEFLPDADEQITSFNNLQTSLMATSDVNIRFKLNRDGTIFFTEPEFKDEAAAENSRVSAGRIRMNIAEWIANQSYYFLKDVSHRHQHHSPHSDSILTLQPISQENSLDWKQKIAFSLQYFAIEAKRTAGHFSITSALGVLAYRNSFIKIASLEKHPEIPCTKALELSLNTAVLESQMPKWPFGLDKNTTLWIAWAALCFALLSIFFQPQIKPIATEDHLLNILAYFFVTQIGWIASICFFVIPAFFHLTASAKFSGEKSWAAQLYQDTVILLQFSVKNYLFKPTALIGILFAALIFYLFIRFAIQIA